MSEYDIKRFNPGDEVVIRPVKEWVWQVQYPEHIEGAHGRILDLSVRGMGRLAVQFNEDDYERLNLADAIPSYLWEANSPRTAALRPRQIRKATPFDFDGRP